MIKVIKWNENYFWCLPTFPLGIIYSAIPVIYWQIFAKLMNLRIVIFINDGYIDKQ